jgi:hypothetical protein
VLLPNELAVANNYFSKIKSFAAKNDVEVVFFVRHLVKQ